MRRPHFVSLLAAAFIIGTFSGAESAFADEASEQPEESSSQMQLTIMEKADLLERVCNGYREVRDAIKTLDVTMAFRKRLRIRGGVSKIIDGKVVVEGEQAKVFRHSTSVAHYVYDRPSERVFGDVKENGTAEFIDAESGDVLSEVQGKNVARWNITSERFAHVSLNAPRGQLPEHPEVLGLPGSRPVVDIKDPSMARRDLDLLLRPSMWYSVEFLLVPPAEVFSELIKEMRAGTASARQKRFFEAGLLISQSSDVMRITLASPDNPDLRVAVFEFDATHYYLPLTARFVSRGRLAEEYEWEWRNIESAVFYLGDYRSMRYDENGEVGYELGMQMTTFEVNSPIDEQVFTTEYLANEPGVRVNDEIIGTLSVVDDTSAIVDVHKYNEAKREESVGARGDLTRGRSTPWRTTLVVNGVLLACGVVCYCGWRWNKGKR